jgi:photosystem II stability/assembly factor-like uncharacterized protein
LVTVALALPAGPRALAQWTAQSITSSASKFNTVFFTDSVTGFVGGYRTLLKTTDGGTTWKETTHPIIGDVFGIFLSGQTGFAVDGGGIILKSVDGGNSWTKLNSGTTIRLTGVRFVNDQVGFVIGGDKSANQNATILRTTDGGTKWTSVKSTANAEFDCIWSVDESTIYVGGVDSYRGEVLKSTDGGTSWSTYQGDTKMFPTTIQFVSNGFGYMAAGLGGIQRTTNGGDTWAQLNPGYTGTFTSLYFADSSVGYAACAEDGLIFRTENGGTTWKAEYTSKNLYLGSITGVDGHVFAVGNGSMILRRAASSPSSVVEAVTGQSVTLGMSVAPNPTTGSCTVSYTLAGRTGVRIEVFDQAGALMATLRDGQIEDAGPHSASFAADRSGTYLVRLITAAGIRTERLTVVR